jgi:eukaryotic-like serine/threonine-protein kinase
VTTLVGRQIGRYRILEELGSGGMSVVYKGLDTALDREVAVKVLHPHLSGKDESRRRLAREAKAVAKLHHPNILEVFDFSTAESEDAYIITEYIRGQTLRAFAEGERFEPPEVAAMAISEIAAALAHAHESGVIHRDLKPENVMVREDGVLKLMDFGIAKIVDRDDKMTVTGSLVGSPAHMAPEIIEGLEAGAEADVFSLGTMLYLLAVGQLPFTAPNTTATLKRILDCAYDDPRQHNPMVSDELAEIISRCLDRAPSGRYPNAGKLRDALAAYLDGLGLSRPHEELQRFFAGPAAYRKALLPVLVERRLARADRFLAEARPAKALACLNHVLALDPANARARSLLEVMDQARRRQRKKALAKRSAASGAIGASALGLLAFALATRPPPPPAPVDHLATPFPEVPGPPVAELPILTTVEPASQPRAAPAATQERAAPGGTGKVLVSLQVRPYAYVQVDGAPRSAEALAEHRLQLAPGPHQVRITCQVCEPSTEAITVPAEPTEEPVRLAARPLPSLLVFAVDPPDATVRVGAVSRAASLTSAQPFEVVIPKGSFTSSVEYVVHAPGFEAFTGRATAKAGERVPVTATLHR